MTNPDEHRYDDMLYLPHHTSLTRRPMPLADRAAQFSPFAALTGYEAAIQETARLTDAFVELSEDSKAVLNEKFLMLMEAVSTRPEISVTFFREDGEKAGGAYHTLTGRLRKIDAYTRTLFLENGETIPLEMIHDIQGDLFRSLDE